jgi:hypothetical protein
MTVADVVNQKTPIQMKLDRPLFTLLLFLLINSPAIAQKNIHARWGQMLTAYVTSAGQVDYAAWQNDAAQLETYLETLAQMPPQKNWPQAQQLAYWINAYNALTVQLILQHYPLKSIRDIQKPWDQEVFKTAEKAYTLNNIEHDILRKMGEPRIHFAINCASVSCPILQNKPFVGNQLEDQLEAATRRFLLDTTKNNFSSAPPQVSRIFLWFGKDFGSREERKIFLERFIEKNLPSEKLDYLDYDWSLNN